MQPSTSLVRVALICVALVVAAGCGTDKEAEQRKERAASALREQEREFRELDRRSTKARKLAADCKEQMGDLVDELSELGSRLDIGLNYDEYTNQVGDLRVAYDRIDFASEDQDDFDCVSAVGLPAEQALNDYAKAANTWSECFDDINCENDSITPALQQRWSTASSKTRRARSGLQRLDRKAETLSEDVADLRSRIEEARTASSAES